MNSRMNESETPIEEALENEANQEAASQQVEGDLQVLAEQISKLTTEKEQINDQLLRTMADFQNFRKRTQQEQSLIRQYATESLVLTLLPVMDNFERTVKASENGAPVESLVTGVKATEKQFRFIIEQQGVTKIQSVGQPFDSDFHEALGTVETDKYPSDTVVEEIEPGYKMGDKVIRHAKVRVAK